MAKLCLTERFDMTDTVKTVSPHRADARNFGIAFILTFLSYGIGASLMDSVVSLPDFLSQIGARQTNFIIGALLIAIVHTLMNIAMPVIMLPILTRYNKHLAYSYFGMAIVATAVLAVGALVMLLLIPLGEAYVQSGLDASPAYVSAAAVLQKFGFNAYHLGMALWSLGGLSFSGALYQSKLLPKFMALWGVVGYLTLFVGSVMELFGHNELVEIISVIPGGLFEVTLALWLIFKGFRPVSGQAN